MVLFALLEDQEVQSYCSFSLISAQGNLGREWEEKEFENPIQKAEHTLWVVYILFFMFLWDK